MLKFKGFTKKGLLELSYCGKKECNDVTYERDNAVILSKEAYIEMLKDFFSHECERNVKGRVYLGMDNWSRSYHLQFIWNYRDDKSYFKSTYCKMYISVNHDEGYISLGAVNEAVEVL